MAKTIEFIENKGDHFFESRYKRKHPCTCIHTHPKPMNSFERLIDGFEVYQSFHRTLSDESESLYETL